MVRAFEYVPATNTPRRNKAAAELPDCVLKRCRSEEEHPAQTLLFSQLMNY
jgi:hypothetical protein